MIRVLLATWATAFVIASCYGQSAFMVPEWVTLKDRARQALHDALLGLGLTVVLLGVLGLWQWALV